MEKIITDKQCSYGCGQKANYINKSGNLMCLDNSAKCPVNKEKNSNRLKESYASGKRKSSKIVYESLPEETKKRMNWNKDNFKADFSLNGKGSHKKVLIKERGHQCESCSLKEWLLEPIPLELEHCDGNNKNNEKSNLLLLCPNCHAKTEFYRGRNKNSGKKNEKRYTILLGRV